MKPAKRTKKDPLDALINHIPEDQRTATIYAAIRSMGPIFPAPKLEICPVCGARTLEAEYSHGWRRCRNCCHYDEQNATAERRAEIEADSRRWMQIHHRPIISRAAATGAA